MWMRRLGGSDPHCFLTVQVCVFLSDPGGTDFSSTGGSESSIHYTSTLTGKTYVVMGHTHNRVMLNCIHLFVGVMHVMGTAKNCRNNSKKINKKEQLRKAQHFFFILVLVLTGSMSS